MTEALGTQDWKSFGEEISTLVRTSGYSGYFGYAIEKQSYIDTLRES